MSLREGGWGPVQTDPPASQSPISSGLSPCRVFLLWSRLWAGVCGDACAMSLCYKGCPGTCRVCSGRVVGASGILWVGALRWTQPGSPCASLGWALRVSLCRTGSWRGAAGLKCLALADCWREHVCPSPHPLSSFPRPLGWQCFVSSSCFPGLCLCGVCKCQSQSARRRWGHIYGARRGEDGLWPLLNL